MSESQQYRDALYALGATDVQLPDAIDIRRALPHLRLAVDAMEMSRDPAPIHEAARRLGTMFPVSVCLTESICGDVSAPHSDDCGTSRWGSRITVYYTQQCGIDALVHEVGRALFRPKRLEDGTEFLGWEWAVYQWLGPWAVEAFLESSYVIEHPDGWLAELGGLDRATATAALDRELAAYITRPGQLYLPLE